MKIVITVLLALIAQLSFSQADTGSVRGIIKDSRNQSLPGATVRLLNATDAVVVRNTTSNDKGYFLFEQLPVGRYLLDVTIVAQQPYRSTPIRIDSFQNRIQLPAIILLPAEIKELGSVTVRSKKPLLEHAIDKTIVNVDAMISSASSNALEVLAKTPGVTVGNDGDISLNGRAGVLVMIDGRSTYMSAQDLAAYLKSLPGAQLDKIELIDNPSARYDAAGNAIINIRMKKNKVAGFTGSIATGYSQGVYGRQNHSLNLNYKYKKINVFTNLGVGYDKNYTNDHFDRRFYTEEGQLNSTVNLYNRSVSRGSGINNILGMDYSVNARTTIGMLAFINQGKRKGLLQYYNENNNKTGDLQNTGEGTTNTMDKRTNTGLNLNMLHQFNKKGRELSADLNYLHYRNRGNQQLSNYIYEPGGVEEINRFSYQLPSGINIYTAKADYVQSLKKKGKLETGFKSSLVTNDNTSGYYDNNGAMPVPDPARSNHFIYRENINALYVNGQQAMGRFGLQLGLRMEHTHSKGRQAGNAAVADSSFNRNYVQLFPSAFVSYKLDSLGKRIVSGIITRRINRPSYQSLNPFLFLRDNYTYSGGNPYLNPQYQYRFELKYQLYQYFWMGLSYNRFTSLIFTTTQAVDSLFIMRPDNIAKGYMLLLNIGLNVSPTRWWTMNSVLRFSKMGLKGTVLSQPLGFDTYVARIEWQNSLTISKTINAELGGYYASKDLNGQTLTSSMYRFYTSIQKKILHDKGSLRFGIEDIFHSWKYRNRSIDLKQADYNQTSESDTQRFSLAFTYRFGQKAFARKSKNNANAADEEKGRVD